MTPLADNSFPRWPLYVLSLSLTGVGLALWATESAVTTLVHAKRRIFK